MLIGCDIGNMSAETKTILTNTEVIAVNQDPMGVQGVCASASVCCAVHVSLGGGGCAITLALSRSELTADCYCTPPWLTATTHPCLRQATGSGLTLSRRRRWLPPLWSRPSATRTRTTSSGRWAATTRSAPRATGDASTSTSVTMATTATTSACTTATPCTYEPR